MIDIFSTKFLFLVATLLTILVYVSSASKVTKKTEISIRSNNSDKEIISLDLSFTLTWPIDMPASFKNVEAILYRVCHH